MTFDEALKGIYKDRMISLRKENLLLKKTLRELLEAKAIPDSHIEVVTSLLSAEVAPSNVFDENLLLDL